MKHSGVFLLALGAMLSLFGALTAAVLETQGGRLLIAAAAVFFILLFILSLPIRKRHLRQPGGNARGTKPASGRFDD